MVSLGLPVGAVGTRHNDRVRIAIMGSRGVPAAYGGFETMAEELGARLVERGHDVTVYGRSHVVPAGLRAHRGMRLRVLPTVRHKYLDTVVHTALSVVDGLVRRFDVVLIVNNANAPFALVPRLSGAKVALNVDGLEWQRGKWNRLGRWYYQTCAELSPACRSSSCRTPGSSPTTTASASARRPFISRMAVTPGGCRRARRSNGSASSPECTCSTSAAWSRRTTLTS